MVKPGFMEKLIFEPSGEGKRVIQAAKEGEILGIDATGAKVWR